MLPVDKNFLPITDSFYATSLEEIEQMFANEHKAMFAYIYMAQPILLGWKYMISECRVKNIQIISFSGDGDTQLLKLMRLSSKLCSYSSELIPTKFRYVEYLKSLPLK